MAETANISRIAELLSDDIFAEFFWVKIGPTSSNWPCEHTETHKKETHPTDVVFWYDEPYEDVKTYVQCDLKSYASDPIGKSQIEGAVKSLAMQITCAEISETWHKRYVHSHDNFNICGMLFVYNHDGGYDRNFGDQLGKLKFDNIDIPENGKIFVLGPVEIHWLNNVSQELSRMRGKSNLPSREKCSFFYPQQARRAQIRGEQRCAATLEMLTGPWMILHHQNDSNNEEGFVIFYRAPGDTVEEFLYLLDYLRRNAFFDKKYNIRIKGIDPDGSISNNFQKAKQRFVQSVGAKGDYDGALVDLIDSVSFMPLANLTSTFSEIQIGMSYDR